MKISIGGFKSILGRDVFCSPFICLICVFNLYAGGLGFKYLALQFYFIMKKKENLLAVISSPEYNTTVTAFVVNSTVSINGLVYNVENKKNTNYEVNLVLFPDGTAKVIE